jgi:hypothetical protein
VHLDVVNDRRRHHPVHSAALSEAGSNVGTRHIHAGHRHLEHGRHVKKGSGCAQRSSRSANHGDLNRRNKLLSTVPSSHPGGGVCSKEQNWSSPGVTRQLVNRVDGVTRPRPKYLPVVNRETHQALRCTLRHRQPVMSGSYWTR